MFDSISPEQIADLIFAVGLLWKSVEFLTNRLDRLENRSAEVGGELVDLVAEAV